MLGTLASQPLPGTSLPQETLGVLSTTNMAPSRTACLAFWLFRVLIHCMSGLYGTVTLGCTSERFYFSSCLKVCQHTAV